MLDVRLIARPLLLSAILATATVSLSACAPLILGGAAATTAMVITDRRTSGAQLEDKNIELKASKRIADTLGDQARVNVLSYNNIVLLTGDVPSQQAKAEATTIAENVQHVRKVVNQLNIGPVASFGARSHDTWLTSKVKTTLINTKFVPSATIDITTDADVVYMMGLVTEAEGNYAATAASEVSGVKKVVKAFEIISREEALKLSGKSAATPANAPITNDSTPSVVAPSSSTSVGVEVMPIQ